MNLEDASQYVRGTLVPDTFLEPLGRLFVWFCLLEESTDRAIIHLIGASEANGETIARRFTSFIGKLELLSALARQKLDDDKFKTFEDALTDVDTANTRRNEIVHGRWGYYLEQTGLKVTKKSISKKGNIIETPLTVDSINEAAGLAYNAHIKLDATLIRLGLLRSS